MSRQTRTGRFPVLSYCLYHRALRAVTIALVAPVCAARGQFVVRSWLPWRTVETQRFAFHYPLELEAWTTELARHVESIDSAVASVVGYVPLGKTEVVVDDPYAMSNGSAWPFLDRPVINLWATPPNPHEEISEFRDWGQMLVSHEFTHIAHLTRPSRNAFTRRLWEALPVTLGPIALRAPRWAIEGYATFAEGRITGSGRPHGIWRATILRQWALEGQLPRYEQLNGSSAYEGGAFAYLAGSAFLEWLAQRRGDASLIDVWRRLSARQTRSFDEAFAGVFGESPRALYGQFTADLTGKALEAQREIRVAAAADTGQIVQRLAWTTGDPAISHDGQRIAVVQRSATRPSRLVVWKTAPEPDTTRARRDSVLLARDPEDVPARPIYPPAKKPIATLRTRGGPPYESPRFLRDGRILLWRYTARGDGSLTPDLYVWDVQHRRVRRVTHGASVRDADPSPDGRTAVATRCRGGWCDLATVNVDNGAVTTVLAGSPALSFYRPRFSPDGARVAVSVHTPDGWRVAIVDLRTKARTDIAADAANRYDVAWMNPTTLVAVTETGGIANIEQRDIATGRSRPITRVTGAALAPEVNPSDSSVWFLSLYARGYDLRRVAVSDTTSREITLDERLSPAAALTPRPVPSLPSNPVSPPRPFRLEPRLVRWIPQPEADADGMSAAIGIVSSDLIGRSEALANVAFGDKSAWRGGAIGLTWRGSRPGLRLAAYHALQDLHASRSRATLPITLDTRISGGVISLDGTHSFDTWAARYRLGAGASRVRLRTIENGDTASSREQRLLGFGEAGFAWTQRGDRVRLSESLGANVSSGQSFGTRFTRVLASAGFSTSGLVPLAATATYGRTNDGAPLFEQFALGGITSPLVDHAALTQRLPMPVLPAGISINTSAFAYRVALGIQPLSPYLYAGSTAPAGERFQQWNRVIGLDWSASVPPIAIAGTPAARAMVGVGESLDEPFRHRVRAYVNVVLNP